MDLKTIIIVVLLIVIFYFVVKDYFGAKFNAIKSFLGAEFYEKYKIYDIATYDGKDFTTLKATNTSLGTFDDKTYFFYAGLTYLTQFTVADDHTFSLFGQTGRMTQYPPSGIDYTLTDKNGGIAYYTGGIRV